MTGGSGFIGSNLSNFLKDQHEITIYDLQPPKDSELNFISGDIQDYKKLVESSIGHDLVIHLAAAVGVTSTENDPIRTLDFNILGTKQVLEACKINNIPKIIFASSSEIYGEPISIPILSKFLVNGYANPLAVAAIINQLTDPDVDDEDGIVLMLVRLHQQQQHHRMCC